MKDDEFYELGIQAGFMDWELDDGTTHSFDPRYIRFAKLVAAKEREACVKIIDDSYETTTPGEGIPEDWLLTLAQVMLARGEA